MITTEGVKKKTITLAAIHTDYLSKDSKRKQMQNKIILIQMGNEEKRFNNKNFWTMVKNFIEQNYENASIAKIIVVGDDVHKIKISEKYNNWIFALDKFHIKKKIKDSLRGNKDWKKQMAEIIWNKLKKFDFFSVHNLIFGIMENTLINKHFDLLNQLLNCLTFNWRFITRWADADYIGYRIEAYMEQYVKITFKSKPKIFNERTLFKIFLLRQLLVNGVNVFDNLKEENK